MSDQPDWIEKGPNGWAANIAGYDAPLASIVQTPARSLVIKKTRHAMERPVEDYSANGDRHINNDDANTEHARNEALLWWDPETREPFASAPSPRVNTGLYRQHAARLNTTVTCADALEVTVKDGERANRTAEFDQELEACRRRTNGPNDPVFVWDWEVEDTLRIRVCAPIKTDASPWGDDDDSSTGYYGERSKKRRSLHEKVYIDVDADADGEYSWWEFKQVCTADTTLGWFELPNEHNGGVPGPLLDEAPAAEAAQEAGFFEEYDTRTLSDGTLRPGDNDLVDAVMPGPLALVLLAHFGPDSGLTALLNYTKTSDHNKPIHDFYGRDPGTTITDSDIDFRETQHYLCTSIGRSLLASDVNGILDGRSFCSQYMYHPPSRDPENGTGILLMADDWASDLASDAVDGVWGGHLKANYVYSVTHPSVLREAVSVANEAVLSMAARWEAMGGPLKIWTTVHHQRPRKRPGVSGTALVVVSVLVGLQLVVVLGFVLGRLFS